MAELTNGRIFAFPPRLSARAEPFGLQAVLAEVLSVTAGVDVQDDRFEVAFVGWTKNGDALVLADVVLWGRTMMTAYGPSRMSC